MTTTPTTGDRIEGVALVAILLAVGGMAGAASFTHVHDWTMANSPAGTGDWFGWANAAISDLVPFGVGLEVRRRRRHGLPVGRYPFVLIGASAALSLAGQLAQAKHGPSGWLLAAVPALGFLALTKLVLSRPTTSPTDELDDVAAAPFAPADASRFVVDEPAPAEPTTPAPAVLPARVNGHVIGSGVAR